VLKNGAKRNFAGVFRFFSATARRISNASTFRSNQTSWLGAGRSNRIRRMDKGCGEIRCNLNAEQVPSVGSVALRIWQEVVSTEPSSVPSPEMRAGSRVDSAVQ